MPDLRDGESVEMQGSARQPYILKNVGGVYSCSCPAWRNQSLPIERRSCKHIRSIRSEAAEAARVGRLPTASVAVKASANVPKLLLAETWQPDQDPASYWLSEKLDGVRAWWDGERRQFLSRQGNVYYAPSWFTEKLPNFPLDGELWFGRGAFQRTVSIVRRQDQTTDWSMIRFVVFDAPAVNAPFETRQAFVEATFRDQPPPYARWLEQTCCRGSDHLHQELERLTALGGEGVMLRQPGSLYEAGRSPTLLKVKRFHDDEARVIEHVPGRGRHRARVGALLVQLDNGVIFSVGSGLTDTQRNNPPAIGSVITFRYQELTDRGVPRFPTFLRVRRDA